MFAGNLLKIAFLRGKHMKKILLVLTCIALQAVLVSQADAADPKKGRRIYNQYCISCHGSEGQGDGDRAKNEQLDPRPRVHANGDYMNMIDRKSVV